MLEINELPPAPEKANKEETEENDELQAKTTLANNSNEKITTASIDHYDGLIPNEVQRKRQREEYREKMKTNMVNEENNKEKKQHTDQEYEYPTCSIRLAKIPLFQKSKRV